MTKTRKNTASGGKCGAHQGESAEEIPPSTSNQETFEIPESTPSKAGSNSRRCTVSENILTSNKPLEIPERMDTMERSMKLMNDKIDALLSKIASNQTKVNEPSTSGNQVVDEEHDVDAEQMMIKSNERNKNNNAPEDATSIISYETYKMAPKTLQDKFTFLII